MDKIKTSDLIKKCVIASEKASKCEDENFFRVTQLDKKSPNDILTAAEVTKIARGLTDFTRFVSIRTVCQILKEFDLIENDVNILDNDDFRRVLETIEF